MVINYGELGEFDDSGKYSDSGESGDFVEMQILVRTGVFGGSDLEIYFNGSHNHSPSLIPKNSCLKKPLNKYKICDINS